LRIEYRLGERDLNLFLASENVMTIAEFARRRTLYAAYEPVKFIFDARTSAQLKRIGCHKGCSVTSLIKEWAASAERRITHQL
jgi:hypothetical protein